MGLPSKKARKREVERFAAFPVLALLAEGPKSTGEMARALLINRPVVYTRCRQLEELGYVVQRKQDGKWVMRIWLRAEGVPEIETLPSDVAPLTIRPGKPDKVFLAPKEVQTAQEAVGSDGEGEAVSSPVGDGLNVPSGVLRIARTYDIPARLLHFGTLRVGKVVNCSECKDRQTRMWWGETALCLDCARRFGGKV